MSPLKHHEDGIAQSTHQPPLLHILSARSAHLQLSTLGASPSRRRNVSLDELCSVTRGRARCLCAQMLGLICAGHTLLLQAVVQSSHAIWVCSERRGSRMIGAQQTRCTEPLHRGNALPAAKNMAILRLCECTIAGTVLPLRSNVLYFVPQS